MVINIRDDQHSNGGLRILTWYCCFHRNEHQIGSPLKDLCDMLRASLFIWVLMSLWTLCIGHIMTGCFMGGGNHYIQLVKVLYCKQLTIGKQLPTFPHRLRGLNRRPQRWEASVLPLQVMFKQRNLNSKNTTQPDRSLYQCGWVRVVFERDTVYTCHIIIKYKEMKGLTVE